MSTFSIESGRGTAIGVIALKNDVRKSFRIARVALNDGIIVLRNVLRQNLNTFKGK